MFAARNEMIKKSVKIVESLENGLEHLSQEQIDHLYEDIYSFVSGALTRAKENNKKSLFVIGEVHSMKLGKSSFVVEKIFMHVAKQLGINTIYKEGSQRKLELGKLAVDLSRKKAKPLSEDFEVSQHLLNQQGLIEYFKIIPTETDQANEESYEQREKNMCDIVAEKNNSGLFLVGSHHLKGIKGCAQLKDKFSINVINTTSKQFLEKIHSDETDVLLLDRANFVLKSSIVKHYIVEGKLLGVSVDDLASMVDKAHEKFHVTNNNSVEHVTSKKQPDKMPSQPTPTIFQPFKIPSIGFTKPILLTPSPSQESKKTNTLLNQQYPLEKIPTELYLQVGFWVASKAGFCANPFHAEAPVTFSNAISEQKYKEHIQEAAAEQKLIEQGTSLEASIDYLFGKRYTRSAVDKQVQLRKFLVNIINGDVEKEVGLKFNELANITNRNERSKQLMLLQETAESHQHLSAYKI